MNKLLSAILCTCLIACSAPAPDTDVDAAGEWQALFDGQTLEGWRAVGGGASFTVDDGEILGARGPGQNSFLRTEREYGDFRLELEMRWEEHGNSGIMFRAQQREGNGRVYGLQYELDPSERAWSGGIYDEARRKWLVPLAEDDPARGALRRDDWNLVEIEAIGGRVQTWLNGVAIADLADATDLTGFIALQVHSGKTGRIRFRNIRLRDLGSHRWTRDFIADPGSWTLPAGGTVAANAAGGLELSQAGAVRTRQALGDFGLRFELDVCGEESVLRFRDWRAAGGPGWGRLALTSEGATLTLGEAGEVAGTVAFGEPAARRRVTLTAVGDDVTVAVDETHVGRVHGRGLPPRGIVSIEPGCAPRVHELAWVTLESGARAEPLYRTLEVPEAPVLSPDEALAAFRIAPGFRVELVAAEPLVQDPVAMDWDERGRLYVVEMRGYMPDAFGHGAEEPVGRVVLLEDTDADGRMDRRTVYLDGLVLPRAVAVVDGGVLIGEPPSLWLCRDTDGDDRCDDKRAVTGYGENEGGSVEHRENALMRGLDNWLYNAKSSRRFRLTGDGLVVDQTAARGQWGMTQDDEGRLLYNNNSNWIFADFYPADGVQRDGARDPLPGIGEKLLPEPEVFSVRVNPGVNRAYLPGFLRDDGRLLAPTAASGIVAYRGDQFPADAARDVFVPEPAANAVARFRLAGDGIALAAEHLTYPDAEWGRREFLASTDERFRPVDAKVGPDGTLHVIDMYRGIIQDIVFLTEELREQIYARGLETPLGLGRIWRIVHDDAPLRRSPPDLASLDDAALVALLEHANGWHRDTAQRLLVSARALAEDELRALRALAASADARPATHALWVLEGRGALDRDTVLAALDSADPRVVVQALRAGGEHLTAAEVLAVARDLEDFAPGEPTERVAQAAVVALRAHSEDPDMPPFLSELAAKQAANPYLRVAIVAAAEGREEALLAELMEKDLPEAGRADLYSRLAANAYRSLARAGDVAGIAGLLDATAALAGRDESAAVAILTGFRSVLRDARFAPVPLGAEHPLFGREIDPASPLWAAVGNARYAFTWPGDDFHDAPPLSAEAQALRERGEEFYERVCASCHHRRGVGVAGLAPPLAYSPWVTGSPEALARIVLQGLYGPITVDGETWNAIMPGHGAIPELDDALTAGLLTYLRTAWGNKSDAVTPGLVRQVRAETADRSAMWTVEELAPWLGERNAP